MCFITNITNILTKLPNSICNVLDLPSLKCNIFVDKIKYAAAQANISTKLHFHGHCHSHFQRHISLSHGGFFITTIVFFLWWASTWADPWKRMRAAKQNTDEKSVSIAIPHLVQRLNINGTLAGKLNGKWHTWLRD